MTAGERCVCCDLPVASCGKSAEERQRAEARAERERLASTPGALVAHYPGRCGSCGTPFAAGDPIVRTDEDEAPPWRSLLCCPLPEGALA